MVEDGGDAVPDAVQHRGVGAGLGAVQSEMPVDIPPLAVQDLKEVGGIEAVDGEAPGQTGVDMGVDVDETGHDDAAPGIHKLGVGILGLQLRIGTDLTDDLTVDRDGAVLHIGKHFVSVMAPFPTNSIGSSSFWCGFPGCLPLFPFARRNEKKFIR